MSASSGPAIQNSSSPIPSIPGTGHRRRIWRSRGARRFHAAAARHPDDLAAVKAWFAELAEHVRAVDYAAARHLFADDFVAFGTFTDFVTGRDHAEANQWRKVWPTIDGFTWRLDEARAQISPDRLFAVGMAVWDSAGYRTDATPFDRKGRATVSFRRAA